MSEERTNCLEPSGSVIIRKVEEGRQVFDENGQNWLDSFQIKIEVGVKSFDLAYEGETYESAKWYANQLVNALSAAGMRIYLQNNEDYHEVRNERS